MNPRLLSKDKPIPQKEYGKIPDDLWENKRDVAHEEACRDLDKEPEQLLVDIHDESLNNERSDGQTIAPALARIASLELRLDRKAGRLNRIVFWFGLIGLFLAFVAAVSGVIQAYYTKYPPAKAETVQPATAQK